MKVAQSQSDSELFETGLSAVLDAIKEWSAEETPIGSGGVELLFVICMSGKHTACQANVRVIFENGLHFTRCICSLRS